MSEVISALSFALDLTEGQPQGHAIRSCVIGMRLADESRWDDESRSSLFYALLLKDAGCSSNAARSAGLFQGGRPSPEGRGVKTVDWDEVLGQPDLGGAHRRAVKGSPVARAAALVKLGLKQGTAREIFEMRCERGAEIAPRARLLRETPSATETLDEHWDGRGRPHGLVWRGDPAPRPHLCLAQTVEVFARPVGREAAYALGARPERKLVRPGAGQRARRVRARRRLLGGSPSDVAELVPSSSRTDRLVDSSTTTPSTASPERSPAVDRREVAVHGQALGACRRDRRSRSARCSASPARVCDRLRHAGLLHDIGKLGVSNLILDKPGQLTPEERRRVEQHPTYSREFLARVEPFRHLADDAAAHTRSWTESGYPLGLAR